MYEILDYKLTSQNTSYIEFAARFLPQLLFDIPKPYYRTKINEYRMKKT